MVRKIASIGRENHQIYHQFVPKIYSKKYIIPLKLSSNFYMYINSVNISIVQFVMHLCGVLCIHHSNSLFLTSVSLAVENNDRRLPVPGVFLSFVCVTLPPPPISFWLLYSRKMSPLGSSPPIDWRPPCLLGVGGPGRLYNVPLRPSLCTLSMLSSMVILPKRGCSSHHAKLESTNKKYNRDRTEKRLAIKMWTFEICIEALPVSPSASRPRWDFGPHMVHTNCANASDTLNCDAPIRLEWLIRVWAKSVRPFSTHPNRCCWIVRPLRLPFWNCHLHWVRICWMVNSLCIWVMMRLLRQRISASGLCLIPGIRPISLVVIGKLGRPWFWCGLFSNIRNRVFMNSLSFCRSNCLSFNTYNSLDSCLMTFCNFSLLPSYSAHSFSCFALTLPISSLYRVFYQRLKIIGFFLVWVLDFDHHSMRFVTIFICHSNHHPKLKCNIWKELHLSYTFDSQIYSK